MSGWRPAVLLVHKDCSRSLRRMGLYSAVHSFQGKCSETLGLLVLQANVELQ